MRPNFSTKEGDGKIKLLICIYHHHHYCPNAWSGIPASVALWLKTTDTQNKIRSSLVDSEIRYFIVTDRETKWLSIFNDIGAHLISSSQGNPTYRKSPFVKHGIEEIQIKKVTIDNKRQVFVDQPITNSLTFMSIEKLEGYFKYISSRSNYLREKFFVLSSEWHKEDQMKLYVKTIRPMLQSV